jgi:hypothetical protein
LYYEKRIIPGIQIECTYSKNSPWIPPNVFNTKNASFLFGIQVSRVSDVNGSIQNNMIVDFFFYRNSCENTPATPDTKLQVIFPLLILKMCVFQFRPPDTNSVDIIRVSVSSVVVVGQGQQVCEVCSVGEWLLLFLVFK